MNEIWCYWLVLLAFILNAISTLFRCGGYHTISAWDGDLDERMIGLCCGIIISIIYAIALGWL